MRIAIIFLILFNALGATAQMWDTATGRMWDTTAHTSSSPFKQWVPQSQLDGFNLKQLSINKTGMYVLSSWAVGNLLYGVVAVGLTHGEAQAFHAGNAIWGGVNTVIGATGVVASYQKNKAMGLSFGRTVLRQHGQEKIFLINGSLDFAYIATGLALWGFSDRPASQRTRNILSGGGKSFVMQGGFLAFFDWGMYIAHSQHAYRNLNRYTSGLAFNGDGLSYSLMF